MKIAELKSMSRIMALAMMIIATFTACSDDDGEGNKPIVFPELKNINCAAGETAEISLRQPPTGSCPAVPDGASSRTANSWKASSMERQESRP